jgi:hypothetical protein
MGERNAGGLRRASIVLSGLLLVGLWPAAALAAGPVDLAGPDLADAVEGTTQSVAEAVEQVPEVTDQATGAVDKMVDDTTEAVQEVTNDTGGTVEKVVDGATGAVDEAVDGAAEAVDKVTNDAGGAVDQATGAVDGAKDGSGAATHSPNHRRSLPLSRQARQDSHKGMVKARSAQRSGDRARQAPLRTRQRGRAEQPGRPDNPLIGLIEAGNEIGDQVEASASGGQPAPPQVEQPATQGSGLPFTGGFALFVALAYAALFCGIGSALLAGTRSRGPSEFRLLS